MFVVLDNSQGSFLAFDGSEFSQLGFLCFFCDLDSKQNQNKDENTAAAVAAAAATSTTDSDWTFSLVPRDSYRRRVYIAPLGLHLVSDAGTIANITMAANIKPPAACTSAPALIGTGAPTVSVSSLLVTYDAVGSQPLTKFRLRLVDRTCKGNSRRFSVKDASLSRGSYLITPASTSGAATVQIVWTATTCLK